MRKLVQSQLKKQYQRTMREAYAFARHHAAEGNPLHVLDCGAGSGHELDATYGALRSAAGFSYSGLEWNAKDVAIGRSAGLEIIEADLNSALPIADGTVDCAIAFSVLEHLLMPCAFLQECHRVLKAGGRLVILTPNISTWFTALQVVLGGMPTSGPHPDSNWLISAAEPVRVSQVTRDDVSADTPQHRHLVVFSLKVLRRFLLGTGYTIVVARGFGYYPFPRLLQGALERLDPGHCHQMVLVCEKPGSQDQSHVPAR